MEERMLGYLDEIIGTLKQAGSYETAEVLERAREELAGAQWCEMTGRLLQAVQDPIVLNSAYNLHENVLRFTRINMSPVAYVRLLHTICFSPNVSIDQALNLVDGAVTALSVHHSEQGGNAARCIRALLLLDRNDRKEFTLPVEAAAQEARNILDAVESFIHSKQMHEVDPVLTALHSQARGKDYKIRCQYTQYYKNAFETVNSAERAKMPIIESDMMALAYDTAVAALLSEEIYNFGKFLNDQRFTGRLMASPDHIWILEWLRICNDGKVREFEQHADVHRNCIEACPVLHRALDSVKHKVRLMALLHLVFYTPFNERTFTFDSIALRCEVKLNCVEPLLLAALAQGIIIGKIDGLTQEVHITWVEPRVLSLHEVKELVGHVSRWKEKVMALSRSMKEMTQQTAD